MGAALLSDLFLVIQLESVIPLVLVKVEEHFLFKLVCAIVDIDGVVVFVESLVHSFNRGLVQVSIHRSCLPRLMGAAHTQERVDESKSINHDFSPH